MAMAFALVIALASVTAANALTFADLEGSWWKVTKQLDTGYVFQNPAVDDSVGKAGKFKNRLKTGYMYVPVGSFIPPAGDPATYEGILLLNRDSTGVWTAVPYSFAVHGGTPNDFVALTEVAVQDEIKMALTVRAKLTENKKSPGTIKSGQVRTLGSSVIYAFLPDNPDIVFAGKTDFRANWIPENRVPQAVFDVVFPAP
jgi:hypothetical protein